MGSDESIHIGFETHVCIDGFLVKFDLNEAIRIGTYDEVYFCPVDHNNFFDVVDHIWQLLSVNFLGATVICTWFEISVQDLVFMQPFSFQNFVVSNLIWIIVAEVWQDIVSFGIRMGKAVFVLPLILVHTQGEYLFTTDLLHSLFMGETFLFLLVEESVKLVDLVIVVLKEAASFKFLNSRRVWIPKINIVFLLFSGVFQDLIWTQMVRQLS